ncbi:MAG: DNA mismatch repair protein MutS [Candidatus Faecisoma sp.]|nr:DNA mismatch repair protein MutS [Candidatus Faecisoma sp.]CCY28996.1 dNA mismatch repair protein MutS [Acholeplasma sp. CAG:878]
MKINEVDKTKLSPMMSKYVELKEQNMDLILLYRLGDFYEMFFEDAIIASRELELTLTGKNAGLDEKIPMCGVPHHAVSVYIDKLIENGYKVAICEQLEDPKKAKGIVKRGIVQVISSGTVIDSNSLNEKENNFLGGIIDFNHAYGLSYCDITTGEIYALLLPHDSNELISRIVSIGIKEIVVSSEFDKNVTYMLKTNFQIVISLYNDNKQLKEYEYIYNDLEDIRLKEGVKYLLSYISETQLKDLSHFSKVIVKSDKQSLKMDIHTKRNLELTETLRLKQRQFSLIWLLDKTKTAMGSRLLKSYIENPSVSKQEIEKRYDLIETLLEEFILTSDLRGYLDEVYDLQRLSGRVAFGNTNAKDMLQLKSSIKVLPQIREILLKINFCDDFQTLSDLYELLDKAIYENPPISIKEGYLIKEGYNQELDELKSLRKGGKDFIAKFEAEERERTGIKTLKVGYNKVFGYYIEVSKGSMGLIKDEFGYERKQTLANNERYISPILKEKEALILNAEERIIELEYQLFCQIREQVKTYIPKLQQISKIISEIDCLQSFAKVSEENNYVRPILNENKNLKIIDNRHPVVEKVISSSFIPNDIIMDENTNILLITGPNMAGKSTYMRQLAITVIMAQIGCFVPASEAILPIFDAIYTRIGASDDLVSGESTFMVEMLEANRAISNATSNSLILFDELGRGTATFDGMALAQAIIEYIHEQIKCKTLFSTHYHELTDLETKLKNLKNIHVSAHEEDGNITFLHKIEDGSIDKSYGIHVAKLAKLPDELIKRADEILKIYENKEQKKEIYVQEALPLYEVEVKSNIEEEIKKINPLEMTPIEAMNFLYKLKEKLR